MEIKSGLEIIANVDIVLRGADGFIKDERHIHNTVTTLGKTHVADRLASTPSEAAMGWMAIGTGTGGTTALTTELDRNAHTSYTHTDAVVTYVGDWAAGDGTGAITEAGIFNLVTIGGTMFVYSSFSVVNKGASDTLKITWTVTIS